MFNGLVYDATPVLYPHCGVGRVTKTLLETLVQQRDDLKMMLYARRMRGPSLNSCFHDLHIKHLRLPYKAERVMKKVGLIETLTHAPLYHATDHYMPLKHPEKAIVTVHDTIFWSRPESGWFIQSDWARRLPEFLKRCRVIITCSDFSKQEIVKHVGVDENKITVIPWGIDHSTFYPVMDDEADQQVVQNLLGSDSSEPYFFSVSCSEGRKNTMMLLDAYEQILKRYTRHNLVLVWNAPQGVRDRINHSRLRGRVHLLSQINDQQLASLYRCATVTLYPTHWEGFGLPILESMACGTPVVCDDHSSLKQVSGGLRIPIHSSSINSLCYAMDAIDRNKLYLSRLSSLGIKHARRFHWNECAQRTANLYQDCLKGAK